MQLQSMSWDSNKITIQNTLLVWYAITKLWFPLFHYRKIGPRSHVWSEKEVVDSAAYEFAEVHNILV